MLQRLPTALAQVKAGSTSENLPNKFDKSYIICIKQIVLKVTKKVYKSIMNSIKL